MLKTYSDQALLEIIAQGTQLSECAFNAFYKRHNLSLKAYCYSKMRNKYLYEDIVQLTWEQFYLAVRDGRSIQSPPRYLVRIARNNIYRIRKNSSAIVETSLETGRKDFIDEGADTLYIIAVKEIYKEFEKCLRDMSAVTKSCMSLHWIEGYNYQEISLQIDLPYECVRKRCERGISRIREDLVLEK